jgi:hypothetical protein
MFEEQAPKELFHISQEPARFLEGDPVAWDGAGRTCHR